jgi:nucleoside-diphosphate-sugar epimerase
MVSAVTHVLVIGGAGFLGSHVVAQRDRGLRMGARYLGDPRDRRWARPAGQTAKATLIDHLIVTPWRPS